MLYINNDKCNSDGNNVNISHLSGVVPSTLILPIIYVIGIIIMPVSFRSEDTQVRRGSGIIPRPPTAGAERMYTERCSNM